MATPIALYTRVSTKDQDAKLQLVRLREWATRMGFDPITEFVETASGRLVRRPEQDKVMALVRGRHVRHVAVVKLDRWGRSLIDLKNSINEMVDNGVTFHAIDQGITFEKKSASGGLHLNLLGAFAEFEAEMISDRTREALAAKVATGKPWTSKTGRTVTKLGHEFHPCFQCGGPRSEPLRGKRGGKVVMLCRGCKGLPALPVKQVTAKVAYVETQVPVKESWQTVSPPNRFLEPDSPATRRKAFMDKVEEKLVEEEEEDEGEQV